MNRKQLVILLTLVVVLGGAGLWLRQRGQSSWQSSSKDIGQKLLGDLPVNDVTQLTIKQGTNELTLVKKETWRVHERNDYPANYGTISDFLIKAKDLKIVQQEAVGASQLARLALVPGTGTNAATVLELKDQNGKALRTLLLGKKHMRKSNRPSPMGEFGGDEGYPDGRYVKVGDSANVAVISDALANLEPKADEWLNKDFFKVEKIRSIAVDFPAATNSWKLTRETETGEWKLADAKPTEQLDASKATGAASPLTSPSFVDVVPSAKPEDFGLDKPTAIALETFDNFTYAIKVGRKTGDNFPLTLTVSAQLPKERAPGKDEKAEDKDKLDKEFKEKQKKFEDKLAQEKAYEKWTYLVSSWTVDPLLKERGQMMVEKKEEPKKDEKAETPGAPKIDLPGIEPVKAEPPKIELPGMEPPPKNEPPKVEPPKPEAPKPEAPKTEEPKKEGAPTPASEPKP